MKLLLDTHAFIWHDSTPEALPRFIQAEIQASRNSLHLSLASIWEMQIKQQLDKLTLRAPLTEIIRDQQSRNRLHLLPIEVADIIALGELPHLHRDPFDRILIAQARRGGFHLVTNDRQIARYDVPVLW